MAMFISLRVRIIPLFQGVARKYNKYNMQKLWSGIRSIINVGKCKNSYITSILNNNKSVDNPNDIVNIFNIFFC